MTKLKKLSKNKEPKFKAIIFYGPFAVGKYTVGKKFCDQTDYKFFHVHHTYDIARSFFERDTINIDRLKENLFFTVIQELSVANLNFVTTFPYNNNYVSKNGLSDPIYVKKIESIVKKGGGIAYFVHLNAKPEILLKRISGNSRKKFKKLKDPKIMKEYLSSDKKIKGWLTPAPVKNNIEIDNSNLTPRQVVKKILEIINK